MDAMHNVSETGAWLQLPERSTQLTWGPGCHRQSSQCRLGLGLVCLVGMTSRPLHSMMMLAPCILLPCAQPLPEIGYELLLTWHGWLSPDQKAVDAAWGQQGKLRMWMWPAVQLCLWHLIWYYALVDAWSSLSSCSWWSELCFAIDSVHVSGPRA